MNKKDRRSQYTEKLIREEFLTMLSQMPFEKITVAELCRRADINRGTFYLHYQDCRELMETLGEELAAEQSGQIDKLFESEDQLRLNVSALLEGLSDRKNAGLILFGNDKSKCFDLISTHARETTIKSWLERSELSEEEAAVLYTFISGGGYSTAQAMFKGEIGMESDKVMDLVFRLISGGLGAFVDKIE